MNLRCTIPTLLTSTSFACVIDPGVLEGGDDEADSNNVLDSDSGETDSGETDSGETDSTDTDDPEFAECLQGTNPQGGVDPGDFPVGTCPTFVCDEGWGHESSQLPIAWTLEFAKPDSEDSYVPVGVVARSEGDGVVIIARRDAGPELSTVSAQGKLLSSVMLPTALWINVVEAGEGMIFLSAFDEQDSSSSVLAISETGELLWSTPVESVIQSLAALPDGGVIATLIKDGGGLLVELSAAGETMWTEPTLTPVGLGVSPGGRILVTGHLPLEFTGHLMNIHEPDGTLLGQAPAPGTLGELWELHFLDEQQVLGSGGSDGPSNDGVVQLLDLEQLASTWSHEYNRALSNCYYEDIPFPEDEPTWDWFGETVRLADGTFLIASVEDGVRVQGEQLVQPRVIHIDEDGEFLASDRGWWSGQGKAVAAGDDGSAYAALTIGGYRNYDGPNDGFYLRKYQP